MHFLTFLRNNGARWSSIAVRRCRNAFSDCLAEQMGDRSTLWPRIEFETSNLLFRGSSDTEHNALFVKLGRCSWYVMVSAECGR